MKVIIVLASVYDFVCNWQWQWHCHQHLKAEWFFMSRGFDAFDTLWLVNPKAITSNLPMMENSTLFFIFAGFSSHKSLIIRKEIRPWKSHGNELINPRKRMTFIKAHHIYIHHNKFNISLRFEWICRSVEIAIVQCNCLSTHKFIIFLNKR